MRLNPLFLSGAFSLHSKKLGFSQVYLCSRNGHQQSFNIILTCKTTTHVLFQVISNKNIKKILWRGTEVFNDFYCWLDPQAHSTIAITIYDQLVHPYCILQVTLLHIIRHILTVQRNAHLAKVADARHDSRWLAAQSLGEGVCLLLNLRGSWGGAAAAAPKAGGLANNSLANLAPRAHASRKCPCACRPSARAKDTSHMHSQLPAPPLVEDDGPAPPGP